MPDKYPPATSTLPLGNRVAVCWKRPVARLPALEKAGAPVQGDTKESPAQKKHSRNNARRQCAKLFVIETVPANASDARRDRGPPGETGWGAALGTALLDFKYFMIGCFWWVIEIAHPVDTPAKFALKLLHFLAGTRSRSEGMDYHDGDAVRNKILGPLRK